MSTRDQSELAQELLEQIQAVDNALCRACGLLESDDYLSAPFVDEELDERINQAQAITSYALEDVQRLARSLLKRTEYTLTVTLGVGFTAEEAEQHMRAALQQQLGCAVVSDVRCHELERSTT
jgi:enoyl-[acyl-carrier-protein] reductase (NADH)